MSGLDVESMQVEDSQTYVIAGEPITLGSGGLNVAPATNTTEQTGSIMAMPVTLGAPQTWRVAGQSSDTAINGNQFVLLEEVSGAAQPLNVSLSDGGGLVLVNEDEVGPLSFEGADPSREGILNGVVDLLGAELNASDHEPVSFNHVFAIGTGAMGPLTTHAASIAVEPDEKKAERLEVQGARFDSKSQLTFVITSTGTDAGREYAQFSSSGLVNLEGAELVVAAEDSCKALPVGATYNFVTSSGDITGSFGNAGESEEIPVTFPKGCAIEEGLQINYERNGAIQTVTGTVMASTASTTRLEVSPATPTTNEIVTVSAIVSANGGKRPFGKVQFFGGDAACKSEPVTKIAVGYGATCRTSFVGGGSPDQLSAVFTPEPGTDVRGSSAVMDITVSPAPTTALLQLISEVFVNQSVTYTATISTPVSGPTLLGGTVQFTDGTTPIPACTALPLQDANSPEIVTCQVTYPSPGEHNVTVSYSGDGSFEASTSATQKLVVKTIPEAPNLLLGSSGEPELVGEAKLEGVTVAIHAHVVAEVKLACHGTTSCKGKVSLWVGEPIKRKHGKKGSRSVEIGSGVFSIAGGKTASIDIHLNRPGRAVLASHHGRVRAYLKLAQESETTQTSVRLVEAKPARKKKS
ncbi:MAG: Ig-like domain-containing protein [Solirubrobacteraceae bacterium]